MDRLCNDIRDDPEII